MMLLSYAKAGDAEEVTKFLEDSKSKVNDRDSTGWSALHWAASRGHVDVVKILIENEANVNLATADNWTAVHDAARGGHVPVLRTLQAAGADMQVKTVNDNTPLHFAAQYDRADAIIYLTDLNDTDINATNKLGHSAAHVAARHGLDKVLKLLVDRRASVLQRDKIGRDCEDLARHRASPAGGGGAAAEAALEVVKEAAAAQRGMVVNEADLAVNEAGEHAAGGDRAKAAAAWDRAAKLYALAGDETKARAAADAAAAAAAAVKKT